MTDSVFVNTTTANIVLKATEGQTVEQVLEANSLPRNLFQCYLKEGNGNTSCIPSNVVVTNFNSDSKIIARCIRNIDFDKIFPKNIHITSAETPITTVENVSLEEYNLQKVVVEITQSDAQQLVQQKVLDYLKKYSTSQKIVAGISGGGDSNTLVKAIKANNEKELICFTLVFQDIWDARATSRASQLCYENEVKHIILYENDIESKLSMKGKLKDCYADFCKIFGDNAPEFFATFLVAKVARVLCKEYNADEFCFGYNREDVLAELIFSIINGQKPLQIPTRQFGEYKLLMPLWDIPKRVLDACYPKFSFDNYDERIIEATIQRNNIYYLSHMLDNIFPNFGQHLMNGLLKILNDTNWGKLEYNRSFDTFSTSNYDNKGKTEVENLISQYFDTK